MPDPTVEGGDREVWADPYPLHSAAGDGDLAAVRRLIASGIDLDAFDDLSYTPLHWAALGERLEVVGCLLQTGASVNRHDEAAIGETPLGQVAGNCSLAMARLLVEHGADPTIPGWMQITALDRAATRRRLDGPAIYQLLLGAAQRVGHAGSSPGSPPRGVGKRRHRR